MPSFSGSRRALRSPGLAGFEEQLGGLLFRAREFREGRGFSDGTAEYVASLLLAMLPTDRPRQAPPSLNGRLLSLAASFRSSDGFDLEPTAELRQLLPGLPTPVP